MAAEGTQRLVDEVIRADLALIDTFGLRVGEVGPSRCVLTATARPEMVNSAGVVHGGLTFVLADTASTYALAARGMRGVTVGSNLVFTRPAGNGDELRVEAVVESAGHRMATTSVRVTSWERLLAHGTFQLALAEGNGTPTAAANG